MYLLAQTHIIYIKFYMCHINGVQFSRSVMSDSLQPRELQHARPPCPSPTPGVHPNSCPSSQWCHPAISPFVIPFSCCRQSLPASESFPMSQLFAWHTNSSLQRCLLPTTVSIVVIVQSLSRVQLFAPHGLQHARLPRPSLFPRVCSNSCPLSLWCHPTISSPVAPFSSCPQSFPVSGFFQWAGFLHQVAKVLELQLQHQSFQWILELISFRIDWFDLLAVQGTLKSLLQQHSSNASILWHSAFFKSNSDIHTWLLEKR